MDYPYSTRLKLKTHIKVPSKEELPNDEKDIDHHHWSRNVINYSLYLYLSNGHISNIYDTFLQIDMYLKIILDVRSLPRNINREYRFL